MGREIYCQIRKKGATYEDAIWDSAEKLELFVCGRDDATGYLSAISNKEGDIVIESKKQLDGILCELRDYAAKDKREIERAEQTLRDLKAARRNARTYEEFDSFSPAIEYTQNWLDTESWSRAKSLIKMINVSLEEMRRHMIRYRNCNLVIVVSE